MSHRADDDIPLLSGPVPGLLDPSQASRLLRTSTCSLFFASFDPHTARTDSSLNFTDLHIDPGSSSKRVNPETAASTNGKRVVIETDPENGTCSWRFVPRAKTGGEVLGDEGPWPRVVELGGRLVRMTQDQWDIHKLDPEYDCVVRTSPDFSTITRVSHGSTVQPDSTPIPNVPVTPTMTQSSLDNTPTPKGKRPASPPSNQQFDNPRKKQKTLSIDPNRMSIDEDNFFLNPTPPAPTAPPKVAVNSKKRGRTLERIGRPLAADAGRSKAKSSAKNTENGDAHSDRDAEVPPTPAKRFRTRSPGSARREMEQKRVDREKKRKANLAARVQARQNARHEAFWRDIGIFPLDSDGQPAYAGHTDDSDPGADDSRTSETSDPSSEDQDDKEAERLAIIEESRRKLAELDKDRPLWEESARRRQQMEAEEEWLRQRAKAMQEEEERLKESIRAAKKQREEQWDQECKEREREARIREQSRRMFVTPPRDSFRWNARLALERYVRASADFDAAKFTVSGRPLSFAQVPWPVLHVSFSVQDVDWDTVEAFFGEVERFMMPPEFKELVEKSHRRFHPDRWRSRGLLVSVENETERDLLEVAGSTVAQALTPLWKEVTGR